MLIRRPPDIPSSEITDETLYLNRREWLAAAGVAVGLALTPDALLRAATRFRPGRSTQGTDDKPTPYEVVTTFNNYYEFGSGKDEPAENAHTLKARPWSVTIEGDVKRAGTYDLDQLLKGIPVVERTYRMRCVEGWSMVIPWMGIPLGDLIRKLEPGPKAKFVEFITLADSKQMPVRSPILEYPYLEGLRMDEALHPLTLLSTGIYGKPLLGQNGAPIRLTVPWKYGFKGGKSIVRIRFVPTQPRNTWQVTDAHEYGFYANVNPTVDHPRWSQAKERRLGEFFKRPTLMFNGYADQVGSLYSGMDLRANF